MCENLNSTILIKLGLDMKILIWTNRKPTNVREPKFDYYQANMDIKTQTWTNHKSTNI
jgi:hypothetical protein